MAERLRCVVERITYQNAENGYSVIKCAAKGYNDLVTVVGNARFGEKSVRSFVLPGQTAEVGI